MYSLRYSVKNGIKVYDNCTNSSYLEYVKRVEFLKNKCTTQLFTQLQPTTFTAEGAMTNIRFHEEQLIKKLITPLPKYILMAGCNYGEIFSSNYKPVEKKKQSGRGRKPKQKKKIKRKTQGTGKYFNSQITFLIQHPSCDCSYKIKLFRNGVFQVPGVKSSNLYDLFEPLEILRLYLVLNFNSDVRISRFSGVMRNYKFRLINENYYVYLHQLEDCIRKEKNNPYWQKVVDKMLEYVNSKAAAKIREHTAKYNPMNIAEISYNTDRCVPLIIKFYRPILKPNKKTTVKLLKSGKINFDGGNSEVEVDELYYWLQYIYIKYFDKIIFDINKLLEDSELSSCSEESIYDE